MLLSWEAASLEIVMVRREEKEDVNSAQYFTPRAQVELVEHSAARNIPIITTNSLNNFQFGLKYCSHLVYWSTRVNDLLLRLTAQEKEYSWGLALEKGLSF